MQTLIILREEFICLFIILYLLANNIIYGNRQYRMAFTGMSVFAVGHVVFDIVTVFTVNHQALVPEPVNHVCHLLFYLFGALFSIEFFHYALSLFHPPAAGRNVIRKRMTGYLIFSLGYLIVFYFIPIRYTKGDGTFYSDGPAAITAFALPFLVFLVTTVMLIVKWRRMDRRAVIALLPMLGVLFAAEIAEIFWTEVLITGGVVTLVTLGVYFSLENPRLFGALKQAEASDRAKSYFLASMSHEIRTPLNAVIGFSELLRDKHLDADVQREYLTGISDAGKALLDMVNDVLDLSKLEAGQMVFTPVETDVEELVQEIGAIFRQQRQAKGLEAVYDIDVKVLVALDKLRLRQILFNLVGNSLKFTRSGSITLRARFTEDTPSAGTLTLSVIDTGIGISEEDRKAIFQPFIQSTAMRGTHAANQGTGLGLAIILRMVRQMGGDISLNSEVGKGSEFTVTLPRLKYVRRTSPAVPAGPDAVPGTALHLRVLLVDDVAVNLTVTEAMCRRLGITRIRTAPSGAAALEVLDNDGKFDVVLTDLWMPDMNGAELACEIRKREKYANLPILALTADIEISAGFPRDIFNGVILKPVTLDSLRRAVGPFEPGRKA